MDVERPKGDGALLLVVSGALSQVMSWRAKLLRAYQELLRIRDACPSGKIRHATKKSATAQLEQLSKKFGLHLYHVYFCYNCRGFHIGERTIKRLHN